MITELIMNKSSKIINVNNYQNCHHGFSLGVSTITQIPSINFVPDPHFSDPSSSYFELPTVDSINPTA